MAAMTADLATDEIAIRSLIDAWTRALRAKDAEAVTACQADDVVYYSLAPPLGTTGPDTAGLKAWFDTWAGPIGYDLPELEMAVGGDVAFGHGLAHMSGAKTDGEVVDLWFRLTLGLRRRGEAWAIVHEHDSVPFLMDGSFRAATALKP
jgi:ketosteroid isomerase-like protein